jgi:hypothetical protein
MTDAVEKSVTNGESSKSFFNRSPEISPVVRQRELPKSCSRTRPLRLHAADASISPGTVVLELRAAVAMLQFNGTTSPRTTARPALDQTRCWACPGPDASTVDGRGPGRGRGVGRTPANTSWLKCRLAASSAKPFCFQRQSLEPNTKPIVVLRRRWHPNASRWPRGDAPNRRERRSDKTLYIYISGAGPAGAAQVSFKLRRRASLRSVGRP